jgi:hypothetical protein
LWAGYDIIPNNIAIAKDKYSQGKAILLLATLR